MTISQAEFIAMQARLGQADKDSYQRVKTLIESTIHNEIENEIRRRGWFAIHSRMDKRPTIKVGAPDFVVFADDGRVFCVEVKRKDGKLRPEQLAVKAWLQKLGHNYAVVRSVEDFIEAVKANQKDI